MRLMSCVRNEAAHGPVCSCRIQPSLSMHSSSPSNAMAASVEVGWIRLITCLFRLTNIHTDTKVQIVEDTVKQNPNRPRSPIHKQSSRQSS